MNCCHFPKFDSMITPKSSPGHIWIGKEGLVSMQAPLERVIRTCSRREGTPLPEALPRGQAGAGAQAGIGSHRRTASRALSNSDLNGQELDR